MRALPPLPADAGVGPQRGLEVPVSRRRASRAIADGERRSRRRAGCARLPGGPWRNGMRDLRPASRGPSVLARPRASTAARRARRLSKRTQPARRGIDDAGRRRSGKHRAARPLELGRAMLDARARDARCRRRRPAGARRPAVAAGLGGGDGGEERQRQGRRVKPVCRTACSGLRYDVGSARRGPTRDRVAAPIAYARSGSREAHRVSSRGGVEWPQGSGISW